MAQLSGGETLSCSLGQRTIYLALLAQFRFSELDDINRPLKGSCIYVRFHPMIRLHACCSL